MNPLRLLLMTCVVSIAGAAGAQEASGSAPTLVPRPVVSCGTVTPNLDLQVPTLDVHEWAERAIRIGETERTVLLSNGLHGFRGLASLTSSCTRPEGGGVDVRLVARVVRRGNCVGSKGSCASASPHWQAGISLTTPALVRLTLSRPGEPLPRSCWVRIGPNFAKSVPSDLSTYAFKPIYLPEGAHDVEVSCLRVANACRMDGPDEVCSGNGPELHQEADLRIAVRVEAR